VQLHSFDRVLSAQIQKALYGLSAPVVCRWGRGLKKGNGNRSPGSPERRAEQSLRVTHPTWVHGILRALWWLV
jgi:hypothetical protein